MAVVPQQYGRYSPVDTDGYIVNDRSMYGIQAQWAPLLRDVVKLFRQHEPRLHSVYVRGFVADGRAVDGISDVDSMAIIDSDVDAPMLDCTWIEEANEQLKARYPFCDGVETYLLSKKRVFADRKAAFYIQSQSVCLDGDNVIPKLAPYRLGEEATYSHAKNLAYDLQYVRDKLQMSDDPDFIKSCCKKIVKRIIRAGMETCMVEQGRYTRDCSCRRRCSPRRTPKAVDEWRWPCTWRSTRPPTNLRCSQPCRILATGSSGTSSRGRSSDWPLAGVPGGCRSSTTLA
jgi:hypothetical protein